MAKECKYSNCNNPVFGGGYCTWHQAHRTDKKPKGLKKTPIKKIRKATGELKMFHQIECERAFKSLLSDEMLTDYIGTDLYVNCFAHIIPKRGHNALPFANTEQKERLLRLNKENVVLLTPVEHNLFDHGSDKDRQRYAEKMRLRGKHIDWNKLFTIRDYLLEKLKQTIEKERIYGYQ